MLKGFLNYWKGTDGIDDERIFEDMLKARDELKEFVTDTVLVLSQANKGGKKILYEGAQGTLLDKDHGSKPYVTSSTTIAGGAHVGAAPYFPIDSRIVVFKSFATRVGGGPFPTEMKGKDIEIAKEIASDGTEFGATTGRARRIGHFDGVLAMRSALINGATGLAITKLDRLDDLDKIKLCIGYEKEDTWMTSTLLLASELESFTPVYETLLGWKGKKTKGITEYEKLPENTKKYIKAIEDFVEVPVKYIGTGPRREDIIVRK